MKFFEVLWGIISVSFFSLSAVASIQHHPEAIHWLINGGVCLLLSRITRLERIIKER